LAVFSHQPRERLGACDIIGKRVADFEGFSIFEIGQGLAYSSRPRREERFVGAVAPVPQALDPRLRGSAHACGEKPIVFDRGERGRDVERAKPDPPGAGLVRDDEHFPNEIARGRRQSA
jgi:hypothetical protein